MREQRWTQVSSFPRCCTNIGKNQTTVTAVEPKEDSNAAFKLGKFPRSAHLLRSADFERVYKQGRRHFSASITAFYLPRTIGRQDAGVRTSAPQGIRVGFTVGRGLGGAVERNRIRRRLREAVRLTRPGAGANVDVVINPKKSLLAVDFSALLNEVARAFKVVEQNCFGKAETKPPIKA